jgi:hypothetical protein
MDWPDERLAALSQQDLRTLLDNLRSQLRAKRISAGEAERTAARIEARITPTAAPRKRRMAGHVDLDRRVAASLGAMAERLGRQHDLSTETARKRSYGIEGFKPHALTDRKGDAKVGASVKGGKMAIDRYISYRVGNSVVSLSFLLAKGLPEAAGQYLLAGTEDILPEGRALDDLVPADADIGAIAGRRAQMRALPMPDLMEAEQLFGEKVGSLATGRGAFKRAS